MSERKKANESNSLLIVPSRYLCHNVSYYYQNTFSVGKKTSSLCVVCVNNVLFYNMNYSVKKIKKGNTVQSKNVSE